MKIRSDNYCCNSVKYLVSPNTSKIIAEYVFLKQQRSEHLSLVKICTVVTTHEAANPADRLQQVMSLPLAATRLDTSLTAASNVEELLVASSGLSQSSFSRGARSRSGTPGRNFDNRGRSPFKQKNTGAWINNKSFENGQMGPRTVGSNTAGGKNNEILIHN